MIELLYLASQIQCGANGDFLNIQVDVYKGAELVQTMNVDDRALVPVTSVNELSFNYSIINNTTECTSLETPDELSLDAEKSTLPDMVGFSEQTSVKALLDDLDDYEELLLVELGTANESTSAYDMQDVVFRIDNQPEISLYAD